MAYFVVVCNAGSFRNQKNKCELCPKGQYQPKPGMESCESCPKGNYTTENLGSTQKKQCLSKFIKALFSLTDYTIKINQNNSAVNISLSCSETLFKIILLN